MNVPDARTSCPLTRGRAILLLGGLLALAGAASDMFADETGSVVQKPQAQLILPHLGPQFFAQPPDLDVLAGGGGVLSAVVGSQYSVQFQWRFNGVDIPFANSSALYLVNLTPERAGIYTL